MNETKHHGRTIAVDWALPKDKYLEAIGSQQIENQIIQQESEQDSEKEDDHQEDNDNDSDGSDGEMKRDENDIINESEDESDNVQNEEQEEDDNSDESENENSGDNDSVTIENQILNEYEEEEEEEKSASENESDFIEIHNEIPKNPSEGTVLFIRNLSFDATEEELSDMYVCIFLYFNFLQKLNIILGLLFLDSDPLDLYAIV